MIWTSHPGSFHHLVPHAVFKLWKKVLSVTSETRTHSSTMVRKSAIIVENAECSLAAFNLRLKTEAYKVVLEEVWSWKGILFLPQKNSIV